MRNFGNIQFEGENKSYRKSRNLLLKEEIKLRRQIESVAALRRKLPLGGKVKKDYVFEVMGPNSKVRKIKLSDLFEKGKKSLVVYSYMYSSDMAKPCPMCTSLLDGLDGQAPHILQSTNFVVVAKSPIQRIMKFVRARGWRNLRLLSSVSNTYNQDYFAEGAGYQMPMLNVFVKTPRGIFHFYGTELFYAKPEKGQGTRHVDLLWPLWNVLDLTPEGRGKDWNPRLSYD